MPGRFAIGHESTRRTLLEAGIAALAVPALLAAADPDKSRLRALSDVEPEVFPWGSIRWLMSGKIDPNAEMTMGLVRVEPRQTNQRHLHPNSAEYLHVLAGRCEHLVDGRWVDLKPGDTLRIPKGVAHQARTQDEPFQALIVYDTPNRVMVPVAEEKPKATPNVKLALRRLAFGILLLVGWLTAVSACAGEPLVVDLWPGKVPGDVGVKGPETSRIHPSPLVGPTKLITNVTQPTLTLYRPSAEKNTGTALVICPGGGYWDLYWELEGEEVAAWLNSVGITGVILKYRCPRRPGDIKGEPPLGPQLDAQRAVSLVRSRAAEWGIDPKRIGMVGFSAGGHLALATATNFSKRLYDAIDVVDQASSRPDFAVLCYSGYLKAKDRDTIREGFPIPADTPPIFLAHASDDNESYGGSNAENSVFMYLALKRNGIRTELHVYATGDHDFGVRQNEKLPSSWTRLCLNWLRSQNLLTPESRK